MANPALTPNIPGQIVRIYLENFMTYDVIDIRPGFHLNMIIGPNGTGKSTIVCAVVLGLGGSHTVLSRGDKLSAFVKSGCEQSLIRIELYKPTGNVSVGHQFTTSNKSQFFIDNKDVSRAKVNELRQELNIHIDNLCTFLPQEKLHEFAKMNPQRLLVNTLRTVDGGDLVKKQAQLQQLREDMMSAENNKKRNEDSLATEIGKNERLSGRVQAIREKTVLCEKVTLLRQKKAWLVYNEAIEKKKDIEKDVKLAQKNLETKSKEMDQVAKGIKKIEEDSKEQQEACSSAKREEVGKRSVADDRMERLRRRVDQVVDLRNSLSSMLEEEKNKKKELRRHQTTIEKLSNDLKALDGTNRNELRGEEERLKAMQSDCHEKEARLTRQLYGIEEELRRLQNEQKSVAAKYRLLENRRAMRLEYLKRQEPGTYEAVKWLESNQHLFSDKVYNPMLLELNVPDPQMAKYVEAVIPYSELIAFTATSSDDLNLMVQKLRVEMKLVINIVTVDRKKSQFSPNIPLSRLKTYGFFAFVSDLVTGPEPVIRYLCRSFGIHNIPVGDATTTAKCDQVPDTLRRFFSESNSYTIRVSAYSGERSTIVVKMKEAKYFSQSVDETDIAKLKRKEQEIGQEISGQQNGISQIEQQQQQLRISMEDIRRRRREVATSLEEKVQIEAQLKRANSAFETVKQSIRAPADIQAEVDAKKKTHFEGILRGLAELRKVQENLEIAHKKSCRASLLLRASRAGLENLKERRVQLQESVRQAQEALQLVEQRKSAAESRCRQAQSAAKELTENVGPQDTKFRKFQQKFNEIKNTIHELDAELDELQARADFLDGGSNQVLQEYTLREEEIQKYRGMVERETAHLADIERSLNILRDDWLKPVNDLTRKISERYENYFASMGCEGEVTLLEPENLNDFNEYGITIRVKFREGVPLQELNSNFQSGGERAVATAIYMLSLQHLAVNVPFRFVDEINQGMDPANERRITDLIVQVTTPQNSSQYFFITPKLLPDLECAETMSVLCVYNGPYAILASNWDLEAFIRRGRAHVEEQRDF